MNPVDLMLIAYLVTGPSEWTQTSVARVLGISQSNVHRSLRQLHRSQLLSADQEPLTRPLRDLLVHAVRHVFPAERGPPTRGVATSHSAPMLSDMVRGGEQLVWPHDSGSAMGTAVTPLHPNVPNVALQNPQFHELMALIDVFRLGRVRERELAAERLDALLGLADD